jgi:hypothetical protein
VIVTEVPTGPVLGVRLAMTGKSVTKKFTPLLATPPTVTTMLPDVAPTGTVTKMLVSLQPGTTPADSPLNVTVLTPCVALKFVPKIATVLPIAPDPTLRLAMLGVGTTVKGRPLLTSPPTATTTFPVAAKFGTVMVILVALQLVGVAPTPPIKTTLVP